MQLDGQRGIVAVAGNDDEGVVNIRVQKLDGVNDQGHIRRVFAGNIIKLLLGLDGQTLDGRFPVFQGVLSPVAIRPLDNDAPPSGDLAQNIGHFGELRVVGVDHDRDFLKFTHGLPLSFPLQTYT